MTRLVLDPDRIIGGTRLAAISDVDTNVRSVCLAFGANGRKAPRMILIEQLGNVLAFTPDGTTIPLSDVERLCPDLLNEFIARSATIA